MNDVPQCGQHACYDYLARALALIGQVQMRGESLRQFNPNRLSCIDVIDHCKL